MIKKIVKDVNFLKKPSVDLKEDELFILDNLVDTLKSVLDRCVGMAANMIGYNKNAIVIVKENHQILEMINPVIISKKGFYNTEEGCLSLSGVRPTGRYHKIEVTYLDREFNSHTERFVDFEAQIIQHEIDHLSGKII